MGLLAKFQNIKACDPFSTFDAKAKNGLDRTSGLLLDHRKRIRSKYQKQRQKKIKRGKSTANGDIFDSAPDGGDDFDLNDPSMTVKKNDPSIISGTDDDDSMPVDDDQVKVARILGLDSYSKMKRSINEEKLRTENKIQNAQRKERGIITKVSEQKKKFLENKKNKKKRKQITYDDLQNGELHSDSLSSRGFGDQVERPPSFTDLPRGAKGKGREVSQKRACPKSINNDLKEKAMEVARKKIQERYAVMKLNRRKAGEFHL